MYGITLYMKSKHIIVIHIIYIVMILWSFLQDNMQVHKIDTNWCRSPIIHIIFTIDENF